MARKLDLTRAEDIASSVLILLEDEGWFPHEAIPGLIEAVVKLADHDDQMLDEAANLLADGGVE